MIIEISSYGSGSRYAVDFTRDNVCALEKFLATKGIFPSDRQISQFADSGDCVQFHRAGRRFVAGIVVRDITEQVMLEKARDIVRKFNRRPIMQYAAKPYFMSHARKVKAVADQYGIEV